MWRTVAGTSGRVIVLLRVMALLIGAVVILIAGSNGFRRRRLQVFPLQHIRRGEVGVRLSVEPCSQEPAQLRQIAEGQRSNITGHCRFDGVDFPVTF